MASLDDLRTVIRQELQSDARDELALAVNTARSARPVAAYRTPDGSIFLLVPHDNPTGLAIVAPPPAVVDAYVDALVVPKPIPEVTADRAATLAAHHPRLS